MTPFYQLIDLTSGNVVGDYDTESEALGDLRATAHAHGWRAVRDYSLMLIDNDKQTVVALQEALVRRARHVDHIPTAQASKTVA